MAKNWFVAGASISFLIALLHVVVIFIGAEGYRYFGAGEEMAAMAESGLPIPSLLTAGIVVVFVVFGAYAISGAGIIKRLPFLKAILVAVTAIYLLRGLGFFIEVVGIIYGYEVPVRHAAFSLVSLTSGFIHFMGLRKGWRIVH